MSPARLYCNLIAVILYLQPGRDAKLGVEISLLVEGVGNKKGEQNFNLRLNHTNKTKAYILWEQDASTQKCGPQGSFSGRSNVCAEA